MKKRKLTWLAAMVAVMLVVLTACGSNNNEGSNEGNNGNNANESKVYQIGISQLAPHPALDAARDGFIAALKDNGLVDGDNVKIDIQNAQGEVANATSIAQKFASDKKDLVLGIATSTSIALAQNISDAPVLFTAVSDPLGNKLVDSLEKPGGNVTGTSDMHPIALPKIIEFIAEDFPNVKTVGTVSNQSEPNSVIMVKNMEEQLAERDIKLVSATATNTSEVKQAAESLIGKVDVILITLDNTAVQALDAIVKVANDNKIPLFVSDKSSIGSGAFATYGFEYYDLGYDTGKMAAEILKNGADPASMAVQYAEKLDLVLDLSAAANQGITVTDAMKSKVQDPSNILGQ